MHDDEKTPTQNIGYYRASTKEHSADVLVLAAQRNALEGYASSIGLPIGASFGEVGTGSIADLKNRSRLPPRWRMSSFKTPTGLLSNHGPSRNFAKSYASDRSLRDARRVPILPHRPPIESSGDLSPRPVRRIPRDR